MIFTMTWCLAAILLALFFSAFFSGAETGMYCVNRVRLQLHAEREKNTRAARLLEFLEDEQAALSVTLAGTNIANYLLTAFVAVFLVNVLNINKHEGELYTTLIVTPVVFAFGEVVPKNLFRTAADYLMIRAATALLFFRKILWPIVIVMKWIASLVSRYVGGSSEPTDAMTARREFIVATLREGLVHAGITSEQHEMLDRVLTLSSIPLHRVMVPRNRVTSIPSDMKRPAFLSLVRKNRWSRLPVYDRHSRHMIGIIHVAHALADPTWTEVHEAVESCLRLRPQETVAATILRLQRENTTMGLVINRSGLFLGIISLKDLMQEIVGELEDW